AYINIADRREREAKPAVGRGTPRFQELVGDFRQGANYDHRLPVIAALHDADQTANCIGILHRRASELHDHHVVVPVESAGSLAHCIRLHSEVFGAKKKPTARSLLAVGSGDSLIRAYFIRSRPPEDT